MQIFPVQKIYDKAKDKWQKRPAVPKGVDWHTYKAADDEINSATNIGIVIPQGVVVIDLDTDKGVTQAGVEAVLGVALDWDGAQLQQTVSGGYHYAFSLPMGVEVRQGSNLLNCVGFDTRTSGKGWICSGDGYTDLTMFGLPGALVDEEWPLLPVDACNKLAVAQVDDTAPDDLDMAVAYQPLDDLSLDDMREYMRKLPQGHNEHYDSWLQTGMAISHQTGNSKDGLKLWAAWSKSAPSYDANEIKAKWRNFAKRTTTTPVTFASIIALSGGKRVINDKKVHSLDEKAQLITDKADYIAFKDEVRATSKSVLPDDLRAMLADTVAKSVGKELGINKTEIKKAFAPEKRAMMQDGDKPNRSDWVSDWVYVETTCEFANTQLHYSIKREAFNAKYDRQIDCLMAEKSASALALTDYAIDTVVDKMYWPGAGRIFTHDDKYMLNSYHDSGCLVADDIDEDGQKVIDMFMAHIRFTLSDEREQRILLDWLAFVVQHPGERINWALLLQGAQGTGKSYFVKLLQLVLGEHVRNLDPTAISGRFTSWAHGSLVVAVEEIRISGTNKYEVLDRMKPFITNDTVQIEEKGRDHRTVPNFTSYLLLTNHKDAIPITAGDRRYCVLFSRVQTESQLYSELGGEQQASDYFAHLFDETKRRCDVLAKLLREHKISADFNHRGRAPDTDARRKMMNNATSPDRLLLEDALAQNECEIINDSLIDVTWLNQLCTMDGAELPKTRTMSAILLEMNYEQISKKRVKIKGTNKYHYIWLDSSKISEDEAKEIVKNFHECDF